MPGPNAFAASGAQSSKPTRWASLFTSRFFVGLWTQRNPLRGPLPVTYDAYHLGTMDVLIDGLNTELSNRLTLTRRPGNPKFSTASIAGTPDRYFSFQHQDGTTIELLVSTPSTISLLTTSSVSTLFTKSSNAGQAFFQSVEDSLYWSDGIGADIKKYLPVNPNTNSVFGQKIWNLGLCAPANPPKITVTQSGNLAVARQANTVYSTMGMIVDANGNVEQLIGLVPEAGAVAPYGTSGNGFPAWNQTSGGTTIDNTITWTNSGPLGIWQASHNYNGRFSGGGEVFGTVANPSGIVNTNPDGSIAVYLQTDPDSPPRISGLSKPAFTNQVGDIKQDRDCKWVCVGLVLGPGGAAPPLAPYWRPNTAYTAIANGFGFSRFTNLILEPSVPKLGFDPTKTTIFIQVCTASGTSGNGTNPPSWPPFGDISAGVITQDNQLLWYNQGTATWAALKNYTAWNGTGQTSFSVVKDANGNLQVATQSGQSGATVPFPVWQAAHVYTTVTVVHDTKGYIQQVTVGGTSGGGTPAWNTTIGGTTADNTVTWTNIGVVYGATTTDGSVVWTCVGPSMAWKISTIYHFLAANIAVPGLTSGFSPPRSGEPYGGSAIIDSNTRIEFVVISGKSGVAAPAWGGIGTYTADGTDTPPLTWFDLKAFTAAPSGSLAATGWTKGFSYSYAYKARPTSDFYVTNAPPGQGSALGAPTGSADGSVSTASPLFRMDVASNTGGVITIEGDGPLDPQVDTIIIFRSRDSGATMFELTEIKAPAPLGGTPQKWQFQDSLPDDPTASFPGLDTLTSAPTGDSNDPPPGQPADGPTVLGSTVSGIAINFTYHFGRMWCSAGGDVFASAGPDLNLNGGPPGNGNTAWPPANVWHFPSIVKRLVPTPIGLLVFTTTDLFIIIGGPSIPSFFAQPFVWGLGLLSYNALDVEGNLIYLFTADNQAISLDPSAGVSELGFPIGDQFANFNPANVYVAAHIQGSADKAIYFADGSTGWFRCNPHMAPDAALTGPVWSPKANVSGGCKAIQSVLVAAGDHRLLVGPIGQTSSFTDDFDRGAHVGTWGPNWSGNNSLLAINNNTGTATGIGQNETSSYAAVTWPNDHTSAVQIVTCNGLLSGNASQVGAGVRISGGAVNNPNPAKGYYLIVFSGASGIGAGTTVKLIRQDSGTTQVVLTSGTFTVNPGDTIELDVVGTSLTGKRNGSTILTAVDATYATGAPGVYLRATNVETDAALDSWTGTGIFPNFVLARDSKYQVFTDAGSLAPTNNGVAYSSYFTMGNMVLANPGQVAELGFITMDFQARGSQPTVSVLLDEVSATSGANFENISQYVVGDPPRLLGFGNRNTMFSNRYYFVQTADGDDPQPAWCRSLQVKVDYGLDIIQNEILTFSLFGSVYQER